jgi:FkbM family methyltransferase
MSNSRVRADEGSDDSISDGEQEVWLESQSARAASSSSPAPQLSLLQKVCRARVSLVGAVGALLIATILATAVGAGPRGVARMVSRMKGPQFAPVGEHSERLDYYLYTMFFSQYTQPGVFVEMGAVDGLLYSNSLVFEEYYGWSGVLIEANPISCAKLFKEPRRANSRKFCAAACDDASKRYLEFEFVKDAAVGGAVEAMKTMSAEWQKGWHGDAEKKTRTRVPCSPLAQILRSSGVATIDLFSLDVEGSEIHVLRTMDWSIPVRVWIIEVGRCRWSIPSPIRTPGSSLTSALLPICSLSLSLSLGTRARFG